MYSLDETAVFSLILRELEKAKPIGVRKKHWEKVWSEEHSPPYFKESIVRKDQKFWNAPGYEQEHLQKLLKELVPLGHIHEFGCGPGSNLQLLDNIERTLYGYDWAASACDTVDAKGFKSAVFDMLEPSGGPLGKPDVALTVHSMEQLGKGFVDFIEWLESSKFRLAIHIEPILEFYDPYNIVDHVAIEYHKKRGYLEGFINSVTPKKAYRTYVGNLMHEAYSVVIWSPS
jgi:hypothetical protein